MLLVIVKKLTWKIEKERKYKKQQTYKDQINIFLFDFCPYKFALFFFCDHLSFMSVFFNRH